jgi:predicted TIM-barrel fold metal-dependent hydrolase
MRAFPTVVLSCLVLPAVFAQGRAKMDFETYDPVSTLVVPEHPLTRARFPFIDVHNHQWDMRTQDVTALVAQMDTLNLAVMVNLSGRSGTHLVQCLANARTHAPTRIAHFANLEFRGFGEPGWIERTVAQLEKDVEAGAVGLKFFESYGLNVKDQAGKRVPVDDPRMDPVWTTCARLGIPVLIHTAAPKSFWDPVDEKNERWLELVTHPNRRRSATHPAPWETAIGEQKTLFKKHPRTTFIAAHFAWQANDLARLGRVLDELPNMNVEFGAIIAELGRQPRAARAFFIKYQDRIVFGKDSWVPSEYSTYFRVLETEDEYFPYHKKYHAFWPMYGMGLPEDVLRKVYYRNALRLIPGLPVPEVLKAEMARP